MPNQRIKELSEQNSSGTPQTHIKPSVRTTEAVQPVGCLLACDRSSFEITHASENCEELLGLPTPALLGTPAQQVFGARLVHDLKNALGLRAFAQTCLPLGQFDLAGQLADISGFLSGNAVVLQIERALTTGQDVMKPLKTLDFLTVEIQNCTDHLSLFQTTTDLLRHLSGYDQVAVQRFDEGDIGVVIAEAKRRIVPSGLGNSGSRKDAGNTPLFFRADSLHEPVSILASRTNLAPLDQKLSHFGATWHGDLEELKQKDMRAGMFLPIFIERVHWGTLSFHHRRPRVPSLQLRAILTSFMRVFSAQLMILDSKQELSFLRSSSP